MNRSEITRYFWYAIGEVALIFIGISLALWFENWNDSRNIRQQEIAALEDIAANLQANISEFDENIEYDLGSIESCKNVIANLETQSGWNLTIASNVYNCRWWTSPYLQSAAYESLKSQGVQLISNRELRGEIVGLYESNYNYLINDTDRTFWEFQAAVIDPVFNRHMRKSSTTGFDPVNYESVAQADDFLNMILMKISNQEESIEDQQNSRESTQEVITAIKQELQRLN